MDAGNNGVIILADKMLPRRKHSVMIPGPQARHETRLREVFPEPAPSTIVVSSLVNDESLPRPDVAVAIETSNSLVRIALREIGWISLFGGMLSILLRRISSSGI
ncbi:MAG: hypothetical protein OES24_14415 [Acidimicrobiia bacterium]|nr:hypothetical protein [Acidimicrobiia bacterium]